MMGVGREADPRRSNGARLFVCLSATPADGPKAAFDDDYANLGRLEASKRDQNDELPAEVVLERYASDGGDRFDSAFGAADVARVQRPV